MPPRNPHPQRSAPAPAGVEISSKRSRGAVLSSIRVIVAISKSVSRWERKGGWGYNITGLGIRYKRAKNTPILSDMTIRYPKFGGSNQRSVRHISDTATYQKITRMVPSTQDNKPSDSDLCSYFENLLNSTIPNDEQSFTSEHFKCIPVLDDPSLKWKF